MSQVELTQEQKRMISKFYGRGAVAYSFRNERTKKSPMVRAGELLKKSYICALVVSVSAAAGLVHNRYTNDSYMPVDLGTAAIETTGQLAHLLNVRPARKLQPSADMPSGPREITSEKLEGTPAEWFTKMNIRTPGIGRALAMGGVHWVGDGYVDVGAPEEGTQISPEALKSLVIEVARRTDWDFKRAVAMIDSGVELYATSAQSCYEGEQLGCEIVELGLGSFDNGLVELNAETGEIRAFNEDMIEIDLVDAQRAAPSFSG